MHRAKPKLYKQQRSPERGAEHRNAQRPGQGLRGSRHASVVSLTCCLLGSETSSKAHMLKVQPPAWCPWEAVEILTGLRGIRDCGALVPPSLSFTLAAR